MMGSGAAPCAVALQSKIVHRVLLAARNVAVVDDDGLGDSARITAGWTLPLEQLAERASAGSRGSTWIRDVLAEFPNRSCRRRCWSSSSAACGPSRRSRERSGSRFTSRRSSSRFSWASSAQIDEGHRRAAGQHQRVVVPRTAGGRPDRPSLRRCSGVGRPGDPLAALGGRNVPRRLQYSACQGSSTRRITRGGRPSTGRVASGGRADAAPPRLQVGGDVLGQRVDRVDPEPAPRHNSERSRRSFSGFTATTRAPRSRARSTRRSPGPSTSTATWCARRDLPSSRVSTARPALV